MRPLILFLFLGCLAACASAFCLTRTGPKGPEGPRGFNGTSVTVNSKLNISSLTTAQLTVGETKQLQVNAQGNMVTTGSVSASTLTVAGVSLTPIGPTVLNLTFGGVIPNTIVVTHVLKIAGLTTINIPAFTVTNTGQAGTTLGATLPVSYRPTQLGSWAAVKVTSNGASSIGELIIGTDGGLNIYPSINSGFTATTGDFYGLYEPIVVSYF